jgi:predicted HAD superfamily Cof-like phosphohydrolase
MKNQLQAVETFHNTFEEENGKEPQLLEESTFMLRHRLMQEENDEYLDACWQGDMVGIADALGDQLYILCGTILKHGLQSKIEEVFEEIQRSNMSKLGEDGKPIRREDGKILKSPGYSKPDIHKILENGSDI